MIKVVIGFFLSYIYWYMLPEILTQETLLISSDFKIRLNKFKFKAECIEIWDYGSFDCHESSRW